jgi:hypothetical protein
MYPVVEIGPVAVRSYSLCFALGSGLAILIRGYQADPPV